MIIQKLSSSYNLTSAEKYLADEILKFPNLVVRLSLEDLSAQCHVSQATIIRFCKKLGAKGFADFKIQLAFELHSFMESDKEISVDIPIPADADFDAIKNIMHKLTRQSLDEAFKSMDHDMLRRAGNMISHADIVHIYGRGESLVLAEDFHYKLLRIGFDSRLESLNGFQEASTFRPNRLNEIALVISQYCNSQEVNYIIDELTSAGIAFILLTANENPFPYNHLAECVLYFPSTEKRFKMGSFASRTSALFILDCLYSYIFSINYEKNMENLSNSSRRKATREYFYKRQ